MIGSILRSLAITCAVSLGVAYFASSFEISFWKTFIAVTLVQLAGWQIVDHFTSIKLRQIQQKAEEIDSMQILPLQCAGCKTTNIVPIRLDEDNSFDCTNCNKTNSVYIETQTAVATSPIDLESPLKVNE